MESQARNGQMVIRQNPRSAQSDQLQRHIEDQILKSGSTSAWLKSSYELALRRDPVDAHHDAELLAAALNARCLAVQGAHIAVVPKMTALFLLQHAQALEKLSAHVAQGEIGLRLAELVNRLNAVAADLAQEASNQSVPLAVTLIQATG